jgi:thioredoxin
VYNDIDGAGLQKTLPVGWCSLARRNRSGAGVSGAWSILPKMEVASMNRLLTLCLTLGLAVPVLAEDKKADPKEPEKPGAFQTLTYEKALEKAKSEKKLVMIDFYADWCGPCKLMDRDTFSKEDVTKFLKEKTIAVKIDVDKNKDLAKQYKINAIPCLVFIDAEGKEVERILGFRPAEKFLEEAGKIVK